MRSDYLIGKKENHVNSVKQLTEIIILLSNVVAAVENTYREKSN